MVEATAAAEVNPLREHLPRTRVPDPCAIVLFGATGDLTHRKLAPALYRLAVEGQLPSEDAGLGYARPGVSPLGRGGAAPAGVRRPRLRPPRLGRREIPRGAAPDPRQGQGGRS